MLSAFPSVSAEQSPHSYSPQRYRVRSVRSLFSIKNSLVRVLCASAVRFPGRLMIEFFDLIDNITLLVFSQFRIDGESQRIFCGGFCVTEVPTLVAKISKAILQVERDWIVDSGFEPFVA